MFEKILLKLKTTYSDLGLGDKFLKAKAEQLAEAVKTEEEIDGIVAGVKSELVLYQSLLDQNRTLAEKVKKLEEGKPTDKPEEKPEEKPADKPTGEEIPAWAKAIIESNKTLADSLTAMQQKEAQQTNAQKLQTKLDELKVSKTIQALIPAGLTFENDEAIEAYANDMKTKSDAIAQEFGNSALAATVKPLFGEAKKEGEVSPDVQAYLDAKKPVKDNE